MWGERFGELAYFGSRNDIAATFCPRLLVIYVSLAVGAAILVMSLALARSRRISTTCIGSLMLMTTFCTLNALYEPKWVTGTADLESSFCMFNKMLVTAQVGLNIGLHHFNITYFSRDRVNVTYNDRFFFCFGGRHLEDIEFKIQAFERGLPNPMTIVAEYMDSSDGGFEWGSCYSKAGYFTAVIIYGAMASTLATLCFMIFLPMLIPWGFLSTGLLLLTSVGFYWQNIPSMSVSKNVIRVEGSPLELTIGSTFVFTALCGALNFILALCIYCLRTGKWVRNVSTYFELNYDTPWATKVLTEDSAARRKEMTTQLFVNSRLRASLRKFRNSIVDRKRSKSQGHVEGNIRNSEEEPGLGDMPTLVVSQHQAAPPSAIASTGFRPRAYSEFSLLSSDLEL